MLEPTNKGDKSENIEASALTKAETLNIVDALFSVAGAIDLQKAAVRDAVQVLLEAMSKLNTDHPSGHELINMTRQVTY